MGSFKISEGLQTATLLALLAELNGGLLNIYGGAVPAKASASLGAATLLRTVSVDGTGTGLTFEAAPVNGMLAKSTSEVWSGPNVATGMPTFYRYVKPGDDGSESSSASRIQGTVGLLNADLILGSINLVIGVIDPPISIFYIGLPTED